MCVEVFVSIDSSATPTRSSGWRRVLAVAGIATLAATAFIATNATSPAQAAPAPQAAQAATVSPLISGSYNGYFVFDKNPSDPTNSKLTWKLFDLNRPQGPVLIESKSWRAGSGNGETNACVRNEGWLPNGKYGGTLKMNYDGSKIKGIVFALDDKKCSNGTPRTELFIHSEMAKDHGQDGCAGSSDSPWCWEGNSDYKSAGCIKMKPADIANAASIFEKYYDKNHKYSELVYVQS